METVILRNGAEEAKVLVVAAMVSLESLADDHPIAMLELILLARDKTHQLFGNAGEKLAARNLLEANGSLHQSLRNVILSATDGEGFDVILRSPVATK